MPRILLDLTLFGVFVLLFLGPVQLFLSYRLARARLTGQERAYVPHTDPWLSAVVVLAGTAAVVLLRALR